MNNAIMEREDLRRAACILVVFGTLFIADDSVAAEAAAPTFAPTGYDLDMEKAFVSPPKVCRPWVYWWWLNANVTEPSITRDLEAMAAEGIGGFLLFDVTAYGHHIVPAPERKIAFMSSRWRELVKFSLQEADRLGLKASINLSTCGGALRAPWEMEEHAVKKLIWCSTEVQGPGPVQIARPKCEAPYYRPVAVVAARVGKSSSKAGAAPTSEWFTVKDTPQENAETATEVINLTANVGAHGELQWDAPAGRWMVVRFACVVMEDRMEDVDILSVEAVESHFNRMGRAILADAGPLATRTLTHFYNVSWEGETPSWTPGFGKDFLKFRGYEIDPYLPALAGIRITNEDITARFLRDYALTISDCFMKNCYGRFDELCREVGLRWHSESGGPWNHDPLLFREADQLAFWGRNAMPQSEFWVPSYRSNCRRAAMSAHVYGKRLVSVEAFTHMTYHWSQYPASLKGAADRALCDGINQFIWHTSTASPEEFGLPGIVYFAGTHVNRNVTWYDYAGGFFDYLARSQALLRRGNFVADVCCYTSDKNCAVWTRAREWSDKASLHLPPGYSYDLVNAELLTERVQVDRQGDLVLPDGMRYRMLVVDLEEEVMPVDALRKVVELVEAGATVVLGKRVPTYTPGLENHPQATQELAALAARLWRSPNVTRKMGKGTVIAGKTLAETLEQTGILPDFEGTEDYIHRRDREADVYFVAGSGRVDLTFRVDGKEPELWDPTNGRITPVVRYLKTDDGRVTLPMTLPKNGSLLVVFRSPERPLHMTMANGPARITIEGRNGNAAPIRFWKNGRYVFANSQNKQIRVDVAGLSEPLVLDDSWEVRFAPGWGAPESITFDRLVRWDTHEHSDIKYFSGTATYRKKFDVTAEQAEGLLRLQLGKVGCIARVRLNGKDQGVVWTEPWTMDLTGAAVVGENLLEIDVANVWQNRLIGDAGLPADQRRTKTNVLLEQGERTRRYRCSSVNTVDALTPSGLMGPVRLDFGQPRDVNFE
ncbi:MAG: glycosyl hydrolase [Pirellulaceae bacterium]